jgi:hypothetical protein
MNELCPIYHSLSLFVNNNLQWRIDENITEDFIVGIVCIGLPLINYNGVYQIGSNRGDITISTSKDFYKLGPYVSYLGMTTEQALEPSDVEGFRYLKPDDGTMAAWIFDRNDGNIVRWNLIMTDCSRDFLSGFNMICEYYGCNMWDYILGPPIVSEGGISDWKGKQDYCQFESIN